MSAPLSPRRNAAGDLVAYLRTGQRRMSAMGGKRTLEIKNPTWVQNGR